MMADAPLYRRLALIGIGLIGSSVARAAARGGLAGEIVCADSSAAVRAKALELGIVSAAYADPAEAVRDADLVIVCTPLGTYPAIGQAIAGALMLSPLVSWSTGLPEFGRRLWHWNVFRIPEEAPRKADEMVVDMVQPEPLLEAAQ